MNMTGAKIRARREELKLSQSELAAAIGMSQAGVSRLEASEESPTDFRVLTRIAKALKQPLADYLTEDPGRGLEVFFAFCPNPICASNGHVHKNGVVTVYWKSWESYPAQDFNEINFCPNCGTDLVKDCAQCKRRFSQKESKYCIRCGDEICTRPTAEEWTLLNSLYDPPPTNDDIPF